MIEYKSGFQSQIVKGTIFWTISFILLLNFFSRESDIKQIDLVYTLLFHVPLVFGTTVHWLGLNYLKNRHSVYLALNAVMSLVLILLIYPFSFNSLGSWLFPDYFLIAAYNWIEMGGIGIIYLLITSLLFIAIEWNEQRSELVRLAKLEEESKKAELKALRSQINPHFLFNNLNLIYSEALKKSDQTPDLILKLSDILRYVLTKVDQESVSLLEEADYLRDYVELQKARMNNSDEVELIMEGEFSNHKISPLLLINFVENCFIHSSQIERPKIKINISVNTDGFLNFECINNSLKKANLLNSGTGIGIKNSTKRLELTYPNKHDLKITDKNGKFYVQLKMDLN